MRQFSESQYTVHRRNAVAIEEIKALDGLVPAGGAKRPIRQIIVHHFWSPNAREWRPGGDTLRSIDAYHREKGYGGIGYHYVVGPDYTVWRCRPLTKIGAHTAGQNTGSIGVAYGANFGSRAHDKGRPHDVPRECGYEIGIDVVARLVRQFHLDVDDVHFHGEYSTKSCPGDEWNIPAVERVMVIGRYREAVLQQAEGVGLPAGRVVRVKVDDVELRGIRAVLESTGANAGKVTADHAALELTLGVALPGGDRVVLREALRLGGVSVPLPTSASPHGGWHPEQKPPTVYGYNVGESN